MARPSFPVPSEPSLRRLGVGGGGGGDRPLRAQLVVAIVVGLVLLAVPLYLWRRPSGTENAPATASADALAASLAADAAAAAAAADAAAENERVRLSPPQRVKCAASATARGQEGDLCDRLEAFEQALARAIRENVDCAPRTGKQGTINYVLTVDFAAKRVHMFPGKSGEWKGPLARKAAECVKRAMVVPDWDSVKHQYRFYMIAQLATYPPPGMSGGSVPLFE
ncbi:MAG: hypothetical protein KF718_06720 [Polyangiaceae bacterium]|nr:hypothetical protein [Polyangiaceae bacterium]